MMKSDSEAVEGMPLRLIITMVVLAITIPLIFGSLRAYDRARTEQQLASEIDEFTIMAQLVYISGPGNSAVIEFNCPSGSFTTVESVKFGDVPGGNFSSVIRYTVRGSPEVNMVVKSPNMPMMSADDCTFEIPSGNYEILVECESGSLDLNGDGYSDTFVRLSLA
jgi:hypothetical protein